MKSFIKKVEAAPISFDYIKQSIGPKHVEQTSFVTYDELKPVQKMTDILTDQKPNLIILLNNKKDIGHFILIMKYGNNYEHFDSYGLKWDQELAITHQPKLKMFFSAMYSSHVTNNTMNLQTWDRSSNTCGRYVVARLLLRHIPLQAFLDIFQTNITADHIISYLTLLLPFKF